jgi:hypothetical protein
MTTNIQHNGQTIELTLKFAGFKQSKWGAGMHQHHRLYVKVCSNKIAFDFWQSQDKPKVDSIDDVLSAFSCVLRDASASFQGMGDFISEFGYEAKEGAKVYSECSKSATKLYKLGLEEQDICDILNSELMQEF